LADRPGGRGLFVEHGAWGQGMDETLKCPHTNASPDPGSHLQEGDLDVRPFAEALARSWGCEAVVVPVAPPGCKLDAFLGFEVVEPSLNVVFAVALHWTRLVAAKPGQRRNQSLRDRRRGVQGPPM
jgi:hypothetical protein